jgi:signal peptidase I
MKRNFISNVYIAFYVPLISVTIKIIIPSILTLYIIFNLWLYLSQVKNVIPYSMFSVASESMLPEIKKGDLVITKSEIEYKVNEIIVFHDPYEKNKFVAHRIISETDSIYQTKGDNNVVQDPWTIEQKDIIGKTIHKIKHFGWFISFSQSITGSILCLVIPSTIIVSNILGSYWKNIENRYKSLKKEP